MIRSFDHKDPKSKQTQITYKDFKLIYENECISTYQQQYSLVQSSVVIDWMEDDMYVCMSLS